jgi:hypothetical protein
LIKKGKMENQGSKQVFIKMVVSAWETQNSRVNKLLDSLSEEKIMAETAPGRNRGIYLVGHLAAISDGMFPILGWGDRLNPEMENIFVTLPDKAAASIPSFMEVKKYWNTVNNKVSEQISRMQPDEWFRKHTLVSDEAFSKEPHRNKLNILVNRTNHHSYHLGQLAYLGNKKSEE